MMRRALIAALAVVAAAPATAAARVIKAQTILPPGQSGFVSIPGVANGTGSPHLYDQLQDFIAFRWKPANFNLPGTTEAPKAGVAIVRDSYGVPAITGATEHDTWWGAGYAAAEDRLFELELFRHATTGTLSEIGGVTRLDDDRIVRQDFYTAAELDRQFDALPEGFKDRFYAYRDGINAYIAKVQLNPLLLPGEFPATARLMAPWTVRDSVAVGVYLARTIPSNADPEGLELANMRLAQLGGGKALDALVPLRTPKALATIPRSEGRFPGQPGRTRKQERAALKRSLGFVQGLPFPQAALKVPQPAVRATSANAARAGGSYMLAIRGRSGHAYLFNGPQLGFTAPERIFEQELHAPHFDVRGLTAPGAPIIGGGYNGNVAWGITTGASDMDDLYAEKLVPGKPEQYVYRGETREMSCRDETIAWADPPTTLLSNELPTRGSVQQRVCRTIHGPVEARAGGYAYARKYAIWGRELETLVGLDEINRAKDIHDVDRAMRHVTWNENVIAADDQGHIGFWHPGLFPERPRRYDERLPYPGTGEAEWRGIRSRSHIPSVIDPKQGWLANWNNVPSVSWTSGDGTARKRLDGAFFRVGLLFRTVRRLAKSPSFAGVEDLLRKVGTTAQQLPLAKDRLKKAARGAGGGAAKVLETLIRWDGSYGRTDSGGKVDAGVAAWDAFRDAAGRIATAPFGEAAKWASGEDVLQGLHPEYHTGAPYHYFDANHFASYGLRTLKAAGYRQAAAEAYDALVKRFKSGEPGAWREPRRMFDFQGLAAAQPPPMPFYDRGTYEQIVELGP
jgi:penicillin G amidase